MPRAEPVRTFDSDLAAIEVMVAEDGSAATLFVSERVPREAVTLQGCVQALEEAQVMVTAPVLAAVKTLVATVRGRQGRIRAVVANAAPPRRGADGRIEWLVRGPGDEEPDDQEPVNFYERCAFIYVAPGQVLGRVLEPEPGVDGVSVTGAAIPAPPGEPVTIETDGTIEQREGHLIAVVAGVLHRQRNWVSVRQVVDVRGDLDFSTGNIDFKGSVRITGNVLDRFRVKATSDIEVLGLIEAATIEAGGQLLAHGGVTGWPNGRLTIGGDCHARFLDRVTGEVSGKLTVEHGILDCDLHVHGPVDVSRGKIVGGAIRFDAAIDVASVGSPAGVRTHLHAPMGPGVRINVDRMIHAGVRLRFGASRVSFHSDVRGPITIKIGKDGKLACHGVSGQTRRLASIAGARVVEP